MEQTQYVSQTLFGGHNYLLCGNDSRQSLYVLESYGFKAELDIFLFLYIIFHAVHVRLVVLLIIWGFNVAATVEGYIQWR